MNPELTKLHPYPFEKLAQLKQGCHPPEDLPHIALSIGEPKHPTPGFITEAVRLPVTRLGENHVTATQTH